MQNHRSGFFYWSPFWLLLISSFFFIFSLKVVHAQDRISTILSEIDIQNITPEQIHELRTNAQSQGLSVSDILSRAQSMGISGDRLLLLRNALPKESIPSGNLVETSVPVLPVMYPKPDLEQNPNPAVQKKIEGLNVFGSSYFQADNNILQAAFFVPSPINYRLGPGDQLIINIWGAAEARYEVQIDLEGLVRISGIGPVFLNGLTMEEASKRLTGQLRRIYAGLEQNADDAQTTYIDVSLGAVRTIMVSVIGEATNPGTYSVSSLSTVFNILYLAGGPSVDGSFRDIEIIRNNSTIAVIDLYDFLMNANLDANIRLLDQDIININPYHQHVFLSGEVRRPAVFELLEGETLGDLIKYAAGFTDEAFTKRFVIQRNTDFQRRLQDVEWPADENEPLQDGDNIEIQKILDRFENRVVVEGAVYKQGAFEWSDGMTVQDLIHKAEGLRDDAFLNRAILFRTTNNYQQEIKSISLRSLYEQNKDSLDSVMILQNEDRLKIFSENELLNNLEITVRGAVKLPRTFMYERGLKLKDALLMSGGFTFEAANYQVELSRFVTDGDPFVKQNDLVVSYFFDIDDQFSIQEEEFELQPYDIIMVREKPNNLLMRTVQIIGEVNFPGTYVLRSRTERISDVINRAGGLSNFAYPEAATLNRRALTNSALDVAEDLIEEEVTFRRNDQIGISMKEVLRNPGSEDDLLLESGDQIIIPRLSNIVTVEGEVLYPVNVRFDQKLSLKDYVNKAGGFTERALENHVYVIYADGDVDKIQKKWIGRKIPKLEPGATIVVPSKEQEEKLLPQERIAIYSAIISMAAIVTNTLFQILR